MSKIIVAFLQNQWFKDPERMQQIRQMPEWCDKPRHVWNATWLFFGCLTGRRLQNVFGEGLCDRIIWEEISPKIGGKSSSAFPPDYQHICSVLNEHKPDIVLAFGVRAAKALTTLQVEFSNHCTWSLLTGPHPASRDASVIYRLKQMKEAIEL